MEYTRLLCGFAMVIASWFAGSLDESVAFCQATINPSLADENQPITARANFQRTGYYSKADFQWKKRIVWERETGGIHGGSHALEYKDKIYYVDGAGLRVYSADRGNLLWTWTPRKELREYSYAVDNPIILNDTLYLSLWSPTAYTTLVALDTEYGKTLWHYTTDILGDAQSPVIYRANIIIARGSKVISLDINTREEKWRFDAGATVLKLSLYQNTLVFGTKSWDCMYAIDAESGKIKWNSGRNGCSINYVSISSGRAFIGTSTGVNALDVETGKVLWGQNRLGFAELNEFAVDDNTIYGNCINGLFAVDKHTGAIRWLNKKIRDGGPPAISGDIVYITTHDRLTAINKKTGKIVGYIKGLGYYAFFSSPTIYGNKILLSGGEKYDFRIFCIE